MARVKILEARVPPLVVVIVAAALMWVAAEVAPGLAVSIPGREVLAGAAAVAGFVIALAGVLAFRRRRTTVDPRDPAKASALVTTGIYRMSRNPMYLGFLLALVAWSIALANLAAFAVLPLFVLYLDVFQIAPEERALAARFPEFGEYRRAVRRWI